MKKLLLTSTGYSGEVVIVYGMENKLILIDMQTASMTDEQIQAMKARVPTSYDESSFLKAFNSPTLRVIEEGFQVGFEAFWDKYGIKRNKERCIKLWDKLSEADRVKAYYSLNGYFRHLAQNTWKTKAEPDTYLRNRYFDNDYTK